MPADGFEIVLPISASPGQVMACQSTMVAAMGHQLGEFYDASMRPAVGDDWLEQLRQARLLDPHPAPVYKKKLRLHDFSFCLTEPAKNANSPLRHLLPKSSGLFDDFDRAVALRNAALHGDAAYTLSELEAWAVVFGRIAVDVGLELATGCSRVRQRIDQLEAGFAPGTEPSSEILEALREAQAKAAAMAEVIDGLRSDLSEQRLQGSEALATLSAQLDEAEVAKAAAEENAGQLQASLENQSAAERRESRTTDGPPPAPGSTVPVPPPGRALRLLTFVEDFYDPRADDLLSNEVGEVAAAAARAWTVSLPNGGPVILTDAGDGFALVGYEWTCLGSLDDGR